MGKSIQYNFRVNMDNPKHVEVHKCLMDLNMNLHKSRSAFIIDCIYERIHGRSTKNFTNEGLEEYQRLQNPVTGKELADAEERIRTEVLKEITQLLVQSFAANSVAVSIKESDAETKTVKNKEDTIKDEFDPAILEVADLYGN